VRKKEKEKTRKRRDPPQGGARERGYGPRSRSALSPLNKASHLLKKKKKKKK
jgi:hypothetical protein